MQCRRVTLLGTRELALGACPSLPRPCNELVLVLTLHSLPRTVSANLVRVTNKFLITFTLINCTMLRSTNMNPFQEAALLNNEGIDALLGGDDEHAIEVMTRSIRIMKQEVAKPGKELKDFRHTSGQVHRPLQTTEVPDSTSSYRLALFNRAIHIPYDREDSSVDIHICSSAVIFNLALTHHLRQDIDGNKPGCLQKASKLYSLVLKLLESACLHDGEALLIRLAAINNLARLQISTGDYEMARLELSHLEQFLLRANQSMLEEPLVQRLLSNMMLMKGPKIAPAA